ncbi:MAG: hypothetical protein COB32_06535 [Halomonas sp.]|nr:MAG: hypothetical protein COB32_06535 [Halomonas sp.]
MEGYWLLTPEILLLVGAMITPGMYFLTNKNTQLSTYLATVFLTLSFFSLWLTWTPPSITGLTAHEVLSYSFFEGYELDTFSQLFKALFLLISIATALLSFTYIKDDEHQVEYFTLLITATLGMMVVASSSNFILLFIGIELTAFSSYALVAFRKRDDLSTEAGAKYVLIGAFSSAMTLYGISLIYAISGNLDFEAIDGILDSGRGAEFSTHIFISILFIVAGIGFKISAVPFHSWAPDVYQGAPTPVTMFLAAGSKAVGFVALFKIFLVALPSVSVEWEIMMGILAIATMTLGNVVAITQNDVGRMLAYSSIAQAGYILMALPAMTEPAVAGAIAHTIVHAVMKGGAFVIVAAVGMRGLGYSVDSFKGLHKLSPTMAFSMTICLLALVGMPPVAGFFTKFFLFYYVYQASTVKSWLLILVIVGILNSAISLYYYLRIIRNMYLFDPEDSEISFPDSVKFLAVVTMLILVIVVPAFWNDFFQICEYAASRIL